MTRFANLGEEVFNDYWMNYLTQDMANMVELAQPYYCDLEGFKKFRNIP